MTKKEMADLLNKILALIYKKKKSYGSADLFNLSGNLLVKIAFLHLKEQKLDPSEINNLLEEYFESLKNHILEKLEL